MIQAIIPKVFTLIQRYSRYIVEWGFLRIIKVVHNIFHITRIEGFRRFPISISSRYHYFFGVSCSISITKDREQLRTENKNYLVIKQAHTHENVHPTLLLPGNGARKRS